ncbi:MAG TPA: AMP-binding protein [Candidatus Latescibacteria bacterium]|nr:AMP-binding protein [Candidatus Latescibacterota bacterium]HJP30182.1 AMP-binding protein [Candidatus Latescibacterota bacterium]
MQTLNDLLEQSVERHASKPAVRRLERTEDGLGYVPITYAQLRSLRDRLASGLAAAGLHKGQRIGILTDGGFEPILTFLAADRLGLTAVPMCHKSSTEILVHNISRSGVDCLVVDEKGLQQYELVRPALPQPPQILLTEATEGEGQTWEAVMSGDGVPPETDVTAADESKILYTSGSSGLPKGVVQTHGNIVANVLAVWDRISHAEDLYFFKSAPDYHSMGILNIYYPLAKGWTLDLARSPDRVLADIRLSQPQAFLTVPLVLDKVFGNVRKEIDAGGIKGRLVARAVRARSAVSRGQAGIADHLVDRTIGGKVVGAIKDQLAKRVGGNLGLLVVGSAKADPEALAFFHDVLGIHAFEGYGVTECAPLIAANHLEARKVGTVGRPLFDVRLVREDGVEVARAVPGRNEYNHGEGAVGELWVSGDNVMREYLDDPEQTARVLVRDRDEPDRLWYRTGDLFSMDGEGFLTFRGRVGRQFKLGNGEFVNPELLERIYSRASLAEHVLVTGKQAWSHPVIIATIDLEEAARQTDLQGLPAAAEDDGAGLRAFEPIHARLRQQLLAEADLAGLSGHERPVRVLVLPRALSEEDGTLTRGLRKVVPKQVVAAYAELIEAAAE